MKPSTGIVNSLQAEFKDVFVGRRVLVTGATGFIGWHLCKALVALKAEVYGISRTASTENLPIGCQPKEVDLRDHKAVNAILRKLQPELIYHLAGLVTARQDIDLVLPMLQHNLIATVHLLLAAREAGCDRFVCAGSSEDLSNGREKTDKVPLSPYAAAKTAANLYAKMFQRLYGLPLVVVRPYMIYGPRQGKTKLIPYVILSLLRGEAPQLSSGQRVCDFIYILDIVRGLLMAGIEPQVLGETVDFGTGSGSQIQDVVNLLIELTGSDLRPVFCAIPDWGGESPQVADCNKAKCLLGWEPLWPLRDGLAETIAWYRSEMEAENNNGTS